MMRRRFVLPAALLAAWLLPLAGQAARPAEHSVHGVVSKVQDGDSLWLKPADGPPIVVRLRDIDAPESCQAWGAEARQALEEMALGKTVELRTHARDAYGRVVGSVSVEGEDLGRRMVVEGHAWSTRSKWDLGPLVKQERQARALGRGLHATAGALQPREFRRLHGPCARR